MAYRKDSSKVKQGDKYEELVCEWAESIGYYPKLFKMENGGAQLRSFPKRNDPYIYPDIEIFVDKNHTDLKFLVDSKSLSDYTLSRKNWIKKNILNEPVDQKFNGVAIHTKNFDDYYSLHIDYEFDVRIIFEIISDGKWFWQKVEKLEETREFVGNIFKDGKDCYFWYLNSLRALKR